ncbi:amidase domain-containing protein [Clostridium sporogenes]
MNKRKILTITLSILVIASITFVNGNIVNAKNNIKSTISENGNIDTSQLTPQIIKESNEKTGKMKSNTTETVNLSNNNFKNEDLNKIKNNINKILSSQYEIMKTGEFKSSRDIVKNSNLLQLIDKTNEFKSKWYKKINLKISHYKSSVNIDNLKKISNDKYIVKVTYNIDFNLTDATENSSSEENYKFEIQNINGIWYITKMLNLNEDENLDNFTEQNKNKKRSISIESEDEFKDYQNIINGKINSINNISKNIDKYEEEYKNMLNTTDNEVYLAKRYSGYKANSAVQYAKKWAKGRNRKYKDWGSNDCTNFVSQAVYAGGIPSSSTWYSGSKSWIRVINFYGYMRGKGYTFGGDSSSKSRLGDVIQLYSKNKRNWTHSVIITGRNGRGWLYCAHSQNRFNYPIANVYPSSTYSNIRYIKFWQ